MLAVVVRLSESVMAVIRTKDGPPVYVTVRVWLSAV